MTLIATGFGSCEFYQWYGTEAQNSDAVHKINYISEYQKDLENYVPMYQHGVNSYSFGMFNILNEMGIELRMKKY